MNTYTTLSAQLDGETGRHLGKLCHMLKREAINVKLVSSGVDVLSVAVFESVIHC